MTTGSAYQVLARKYRPRTFQEMVGQDVLVKTLEGSIIAGRVAHAYLFTGIRGTGKTTTARLLARGLNCIGEDGQGHETTSPCGVCSHCVSILKDSHMDIIEMDAASRTGVDDIRELIESASYRPVSARYKIYIIDEVHMLSKSAFNALLKTLEEPRGHVKFLFATTDAHKVPVTILSRCHRFDLKRISKDVLIPFLKGILGKENLRADDRSLELIADASEGSARDALSLLDQAVNLARGGAIEASFVATMVGRMGDQELLGLLNDLFRGAVTEALGKVQAFYDQGVSAPVILDGLLTWIHALTMEKATGLSHVGAPALYQEILGAAALPLLSRAWQLLIKGREEIGEGPSAFPMLQMLLIRFCYVRDVPPLGQLIASLDKETSDIRSVELRPLSAPPPSPEKPSSVVPATFEELVRLFDERKEPLLAETLRQSVVVQKLAPAIFHFGSRDKLADNFSVQLRQHLKAWTGLDWEVKMAAEAEGHTLKEKTHLKKEALRTEALENPAVQTMLQAFPGAELQGVILDNEGED